MKAKKLLSFLIAALMIACFMFTTSADMKNDFISPKSSVSAELSSIMNDAASDELIPVSIWITEVNIDEVEQAVLEETGLNKALIAEMYAQGYEFDGAEIDKYIFAERRIYAERQLSISESFLLRLNTSQMNTPLSERSTYISKYAPCIITKLNKNEIASLTENSLVNEIEYAPEFMLEEPIMTSSNEAISSQSINNISEALSAIRVPYTRDTLGYTGSGIKIGQTESDMPDLSNSYLANTNITVYGNEPVNEHASFVAGIMMNKTIGIVPDAELYSIDSSSTGFLSGVEWLIDQGVTVINHSGASGGSATGTYTAQDKWIDHLAINHSVHFVQVAGNTNSYIRSPGMSFNAITVGSANTRLNSRAGFSSYKRSETFFDGKLSDKPDIIAPGDLMFIFTKSTGGTSYSAPIVTGIIAQMMQANPVLKTLQDSLKACLLASINDSTLRYIPGETGYIECGAGLVDAQSAVNTARMGRFTLNQYFESGVSANTTKQITFTVNPSDTIKRIALTWLINNNISGNHAGSTPTIGAYVDLDSEIYDPNGNLIASSAVTYGNVEIAQFVPTISGTYTAKITIKNSPAQRTYYGVAWW